MWLFVFSFFEREYVMNNLDTLKEMSSALENSLKKKRNSVITMNEFNDLLSEIGLIPKGEHHSPIGNLVGIRY